MNMNLTPREIRTLNIVADYEAEGAPAGLVEMVTNRHFGLGCLIGLGAVMVDERGTLHVTPKGAHALAKAQVFVPR